MDRSVRNGSQRREDYASQSPMSQMSHQYEVLAINSPQNPHGSFHRHHSPNPATQLMFDNCDDSSPENVSNSSRNKSAFRLSQPRTRVLSPEGESVASRNPHTPPKLSLIKPALPTQQGVNTNADTKSRVLTLDRSNIENVDPQIRSSNQLKIRRGLFHDMRPLASTTTSLDVPSPRSKACREDGPGEIYSISTSHAISGASSPTSSHLESNHGADEDCFKEPMRLPVREPRWSPVSENDSDDDDKSRRRASPHLRIEPPDDDMPSSSRSFSPRLRSPLSCLPRFGGTSPHLEDLGGTPVLQMGDLPSMHRAISPNLEAINSRTIRVSSMESISEDSATVVPAVVPVGVTIVSPTCPSAPFLAGGATSGKRSVDDRDDYGAPLSRMRTGYNPRLRNPASASVSGELSSEGRFPLGASLDSFSRSHSHDCARVGDNAGADAEPDVGERRGLDGAHSGRPAKRVSRSLSTPLVACRADDTRILPSDGTTGESIPVVTPRTIKRLLDGEFDESVSQVHIVDCRFPYEFDGGHIRGATNIGDPRDVQERFFSEGFEEISKRVVIVFHCEFSSHRAPRMAKWLRTHDRHTIGYDRYPEVYYPNVYVLKGGYKTFYEQEPECCDGGYTTMNDGRFAEHLAREWRSMKRSWSSLGVRINN
eukprot:Rmarinus@m.4626